MGSFTLDTTNPTVSAGSDQTKNSSFTQDATTSDATSGIASYLWEKQSGTGTITFGTATLEDTTISSDTDGTFVIRLTVTDNAGNSNTDDFTLLWDATAPTISSIASSLGISGSTQTATVTWTTNEASSTQLEYGLTNSYGNTTTEVDTSTRVTSHSTSVVLSNCQLYHLRAISKDVAANQGTSDDFTIQTACAGGLTVYPEAKSEITPTPAPPPDPVTKIEETQQITLMQKIIELLTEIIKILMKRKGLI